MWFARSVQPLPLFSFGAPGAMWVQFYGRSLAEQPGGCMKEGSIFDQESIKECLRKVRSLETVMQFDEIGTSEQPVGGGIGIGPAAVDVGRVSIREIQNPCAQLQRARNGHCSL